MYLPWNFVILSYLCTFKVSFVILLLLLSSRLGYCSGVTILILSSKKRLGVWWCIIAGWEFSVWTSLWVPVKIDILQLGSIPWMTSIAALANRSWAGDMWVSAEFYLLCCANSIIKKQEVNWISDRTWIIVRVQNLRAWNGSAQILKWWGSPSISLFCWYFSFFSDSIGKG